MDPVWNTLGELEDLYPEPFGFDFLSTCAESLAVVPTST